jgi:hypothetical protein
MIGFIKINNNLLEIFMLIIMLILAIRKKRRLNYDKRIALSGK